ncbi:MAG: HD domain-containing protein [Saprospiraceae bacterium]
MDYTATKAFILTKLSTELSDDLFYHGKHHTLDVLNVVQELAEAERLTSTETLLLKTAVLFHDAGFTISYQNHEELGCELVRKHLPSFGYAAAEIQQICGMIMATKIPQSPQNHLEEIICDADLDYLGRDDFKSIGDTLFEELKAKHILEDRTTWDRIQVNFLEAHAFFTETNQARRAPKKQLHLDQLKKIVNGYEKKGI